MKTKLVTFGVALIAMATVGVTQLQTLAAEPGQVGDAPRCSIDIKGQRDSAFAVADNKATVDFTVKGSENCKVQVSGNSFYAPSMDGTPYEKQVLFDRKTKVLTKGDHKITVDLPSSSTEKKGCFYQIDLTYGTNNVQPVLAYGHGKIKGCGENQPKPEAACVNVIASMQDVRNKFMVTATATAKNGATIKSYAFKVTQAGKTIFDKTYESGNTTQSVVYQDLGPGDYSVAVTVNTSEGAKSGAECKTTFTVTPPPTTSTPGVTITKSVIKEGQKYALVNKDVEFNYLVTVTNTGSTDLDGVTVTDTPDSRITLISVEPPTGATIKDNKLTVTGLKLLKNESRMFTVKAKVPSEQAGRIPNTACVDAPSVPGSPDKCDTAEVEVPPTPVPGQIEACVINEKAVRMVNEADVKANPTIYSTNLDDCKDQVTPTEMPKTGPTETVLSIVGAMSLAGASAYYIASRRQMS